MINSKSEYHYYLKADRIALGQPQIKNPLISFFFSDSVYRFQKLLRKMEYLNNCKRGLYWKMVKTCTYFRFKKLSEKLGFTIPFNAFGPGLSIAHPGTIVINESARIGANCRIHVCVNIGTEAGFSGRAPVIGDNVYIAPGAKIFGEIKIANNIAIAANAVVNKDFLTEKMAIGGVPARELKPIDTANTNILATEIMALGIDEHILKGKAALEINKLYLKK